LADQQYDVVVIGSGPGGYVAGIRAGQLGMKVAVIEKDPFLGGTCTHRGCIPTKALLANAEVWEKIQKAKEFGITVGEVKLDFKAGQDRKQAVVDKNAKGIEFLFKKNKVDRITGFGRLAGKGVVEVQGEGGTQKLNAKNIILAMGSTPKDLPHIKADGKRIINSDHILKLTEVPKSMLVIGAGAVGCEFASLLADFGSEVTLLEALGRVLPGTDADVSAVLTRSFSKRGIGAHAGVRVTSIEGTRELTVSFDGNDGAQSVTVDRVIGHRDTNSTECPGNVLYSQLTELRRMVGDLSPSPVLKAPPSRSRGRTSAMCRDTGSWSPRRSSPRCTRACCLPSYSAPRSRSTVGSSGWRRRSGPPTSPASSSSAGS